MQDYADLPRDPQLEHLGAFATLDGVTGHPVTLVAHPARYDGKAPGIRLAPQPLGAQTREILASLGYAPAEMTSLREAGAIAWPDDRQGEPT